MIGNKIENKTPKQLFFTVFLLILAYGSCSSSPAESPNAIRHDTGTELGTVTVTVTVSEDRNTGEITGDTMNYGTIDKMSNALSRELNNSIIAEKAYGIAVYDIIQQVRGKGGSAVANVISNVDRKYDPETRIETVTVIITADAVKPDKNKK